MIPIIDVFAGPGGLGEGFSSLRNEAGERLFKIKLSIEKEKHAHQTLRLRAFFRQFEPDMLPDEYYEVLRGQRAIADLFQAYPTQATRATDEAIQETLGPESWPVIEQKIKTSLNGERDWLLIGGPPCQAYSLVGRSRNKNKQGYEPLKDEKHFLYKEYLRIIANFWPAVFVMENVKGLLSSKPDPEDDPIFARILSDLSAPAEAEGAPTKNSKRAHAYRLFSLSPRRAAEGPAGAHFVLRAEEHGVPQARHRVIIIGVRDDFTNSVPRPLATYDPVPVSAVLKGLPKLRSGLTDTADSDEAWLGVFATVEERRWFKTMLARSPYGVYETALDSLRSLAIPSSSRGAEFVACTPRISHKPDWFLDPKMKGVCNHSSRAHITKDIHRYFFAACFAASQDSSPKLLDFPMDLLPAHRNVESAIVDRNMFLDRFRVQPWSRPSTTITSHISKDGHYYIHPDPKQARSLTVREAARLQSFPDNYLFTGPRTAQYIQVGNAVPPLLAQEIAKSVAQLFQSRTAD